MTIKNDIKKIMLKNLFFLLIPIALFCSLYPMQNKIIYIQTKISVPHNLKKPLIKKSHLIDMPITESLSFIDQEHIRIFLFDIYKIKEMYIQRMQYSPNRKTVKITHQSTFDNKKLISCLHTLIKEYHANHLIAYIGQAKPKPL